MMYPWSFKHSSTAAINMSTSSCFSAPRAFRRRDEADQLDAGDAVFFKQRDGVAGAAARREHRVEYDEVSFRRVGGSLQ